VIVAGCLNPFIVNTLCFQFLNEALIAVEEGVKQAAAKPEKTKPGIVAGGIREKGV
jgi:hypothetical protein